MIDYILRCSAFFLIICPALSLAQENAKISRVIVIEEEGGQLLARVDLGSLKAGDRAEATLELVNDSVISMPIMKMQTSCSCIKVESQQNEIPAQGSLNLAFSVDVPRDAKSPKQMLQFSIFYTDSLAITVYVQFEIAGMATFQNVLTYHTTAPLGAKSHSFRIPVLVTKPVKLNAVDITTSDSLRGLLIAKEEESGEQWLGCKISLDPKSAETLVGRLYMKAPGSEKASDIHLIIEVAKPVSIAPAILQFKLVSKNELAYNAVGIVQISAETADMPKTDTPGAVDFQWNIDSGTLEFKSKRLSERIHRLSFIWRPDLNDDGTAVDADAKPKNISGQVLYNKNKIDLSIPVAFHR